MAVAIEDLKLLRVFDTLVMKAKLKDTVHRVDIFEGWSDERKIAYMKGLLVKLPEATRAPGFADLKHAKIPDNVVCDVSNDDTAQGNYEASVGHYLSWQYTESDARFEFGSERRRSFVTRPFGTFIFYFRYDEHVVGLVIDGQCGYVEGCVTRIYRDDNMIQEFVLQFKRGTSNPNDYIKSKRIHNLKFGGNYTEGRKIWDVELSLDVLRKTIVKIASFKPKIDKEPSAVMFERLTLYAAEAPRISGVFRSTSKSLSSEVNETTGFLRIPKFEEPIVLNYKQLSMHALGGIKKRIFMPVSGTTPRNLFHVLSSVVLLRRQVIYPTQFLLPDAPQEKPERPLQGEKGQQINKTRRLELLNERGTRYSILLHGGEEHYENEDWILDLWGESLCKDWNQLEAAAREMLDLTKDLVEKFTTGVSMAAPLPLGLSYPTLAAAPHMFINGYKNVLAVAVETDYSYPHADKIKEYLKVGAPAPLGLVAPVDAIPPGNTGPDPSQTSFFQVLNIPAKINKGTVGFITPVELTKKSDKNVVVVAVETDYSYPHADKIKEYLKVILFFMFDIPPIHALDSSKFAAAAPVAAADYGAEC
ncbi:hypothetical protein C2845_PM13G02280 [Panicum miliaceum]|uniref:rRNA N-glycosidase n=1 Tax=Panicum miliaceum TaxID=4540 RepID=A0A3L6RH44_PANMI|nr:hypothetical protein C2845_PM13G02280 [Panicum miliaceum]